MKRITIWMAALAVMILETLPVTGYAQTENPYCDGLELGIKTYCITWNAANAVGGLDGDLIQLINDGIQQEAVYDIPGVVMGVYEIVGGIPAYHTTFAGTTSFRDFSQGGGFGNHQFCGNDICEEAQVTIACGSGDGAGLEACASIATSQETPHTCTVLNNRSVRSRDNYPDGNNSYQCTTYLADRNLAAAQCAGDIRCTFTVEPPARPNAAVQEMCRVSVLEDWNGHDFQTAACSGCDYDVVSLSAHRWSCLRDRLAPQAGETPNWYAGFDSDPQGYICDRYQEYLDQYGLSVQQVPGEVTLTFIPTLAGLERVVITGRADSQLCGN